MTKPLVSVMIPSRGRFDRLLETVDSFLAMPDKDAIEIRVWFDDDDNASIERAGELAIRSAIVHVGPRRKGYDSLGFFYCEMAQGTNAPWIWIFDDDATIHGGKFAAALAEIKPERCTVNAAEYRINACRYDRAYQFPIIPNGSWKEVAPVLGQPVDGWLYEQCVLKRKWKQHFLKGIYVQHNWKDRRNT